MFLDNQSILKNINDIHFDFKDYLSKKDSIIFKNCKNLNIRINSKINKLIFKNCSNIDLFCSATISGIDIEKSNLKLIPTSPHDLKYIDCFKSKVKIVCNDFYILEKFKINVEDSSITYQL